MNAMWQSYPSIDDAVAVEKIRRNTFNLECVALEKVDGSNFAFETNGDIIQYYSRNKALGHEDN